MERDVSYSLSQLDTCSSVYSDLWLIIIAVQKVNNLPTKRSRWRNSTADLNKNVSYFVPSFLHRVVFSSMGLISLD